MFSVRVCDNCTKRRPAWRACPSVGKGDAEKWPFLRKQGGPASRYLEPCTLASTCLRLAWPVSLLNVRDGCYIARHSGPQVPNSRRVFSSRARALVPTSGTRVPSGHAMLRAACHGPELPVRPPGVLDKYRAGTTTSQHDVSAASGRS